MPIFSVPPQMIGDTSKQTFANFEAAELNFLALAILPWVTRFEQEFNRALLPLVPSAPAATLREAQHLGDCAGRPGAPQPLLRPRRQWGWLSANDIRRLEDMEPIGPEGDVNPYAHRNMQPIPPSPKDTGGDCAQRATQALRMVR